MATIPRDVVDNLTFSLNKLSEAAQRAIRQMLANIVYTDIADLREQLIEILEPFFGAATDDAAAYAANMYDEIRELSAGRRLGAIPDSMRKPEATEGAIRSFVGVVDDKGIDELLRLICERVDYEIKKAAGSCIMGNAARDPLKPKYARVPTGAETCDFCIMLASRGFVYSSENAASNELDHYHFRCDCRVVPGFEGYTEVEGYDPDALYDIWKASGFDPGSPQQRSRSKYAYEGDGGLPSFKDFSDVKEYLYSAISQKDLQHRFSVLGSIYGFKSEQMRSKSLKNVVKTAERQLAARR